MAAMNGCPSCDRWKHVADYLCDECSGRNSLKSYCFRTANLTACLEIAATEEMRTRYVEQRLAANMKTGAK